MGAHLGIPDAASIGSDINAAWRPLVSLTKNSGRASLRATATWNMMLFVGSIRHYLTGPVESDFRSVLI